MSRRTVVLWLGLVGSAAQGCDAGVATTPPAVERPVPTSVNAAIAPTETYKTTTTPTTREPIDSTDASGDAIVGAPDDAGYLVRPSDTVPRGYDYVPLEAGRLAPFLTTVQERLATHDSAWLAALVAGDGQSPPALDLLGLDGAKHSATVEERAVADGLDALFAAGSRPIVQGYYAQRGKEHALITFDDAVERDAIDSLHLVVTGWRGVAPTLAAALPSPAPAAAVWRFERAGAGWRWNRWRWATDGGYEATLLATERIVNGAGQRRSSIYHIVRTAARWPTPAAQATRTVPSPDGAWTAREVGGPFQPIDPRDPASSRMFVGVEIEHAATGGRWLPIALWESGDIGTASTHVIGWRPDSAQVIVATVRCGDGCAGHCDHALSVFDGASGTTRPLPGPRSDPAVDPTGRFVAGFAYEAGAAPSRAVVIADLDAQSVVSATFPAEEVSSLAWAPDGTAIAFTISDRYAMCAKHPASHLARFDIATGALSTLTPVDARHRRIQRWNADGTLEVAVFDGGMVWYDRVPDATEIRDARTGDLVSEGAVAAP